MRAATQGLPPPPLFLTRLFSARLSRTVLQGAKEADDCVRPRTLGER
jgi:hypothetical protein